MKFLSFAAFECESVLIAGESVADRGAAFAGTAPKFDEFSQFEDALASYGTAAQDLAYCFQNGIRDREFGLWVGGDRWFGESAHQSLVDDLIENSIDSTGCCG